MRNFPFLQRQNKTKKGIFQESGVKRRREKGEEEWEKERKGEALKLLSGGTW